MSVSLAFDASNSALVLIDVQERFLSAVPEIAEDQPCGRHCRILLEAAAILRIPRLITEQYPKGLGPTLPHLVAVAEQVPRLAKMHFSCADEPTVQQAIDECHRQHIVICGIEAHVCVLTTVADLLQRGYHVVVAGDAIASRNPAHVTMATTAMRDLGAIVLPCESIVMRWQRRAGNECFKSLSKLIR
jgi:nicotinamidase-related amidase